jgi:hypothetical protein
LPLPGHVQLRSLADNDFSLRLLLLLLSFLHWTSSFHYFSTVWQWLTLQFRWHLSCNDVFGLLFYYRMQSLKARAEEGRNKKKLWDGKLRLGQYLHKQLL